MVSLVPSSFVIFSIVCFFIVFVGFRPNRQIVTVNPKPTSAKKRYFLERADRLGRHAFTLHLTDAIPVTLKFFLYGFLLVEKFDATPDELHKTPMSGRPLQKIL